jgi:hypothetical protein
VMTPLFPNYPTRDVRIFLGSARASRAVSCALAGNSLEGNDSIVLTRLFDGSALIAARRGRRAGHARRVRSPIL